MDKNNNTGYKNAGSYNTGNLNTGNLNTGYRNTGDLNTGNSNTGDWNTGHCNTGYKNTGDLNTGSYNTGDWNTGYKNTGDWNNTDKETGYFNTIQSEYINIFNNPCKRELWNNATIPTFLYFDLNEWVYENYMSEQEKVDNETYKTTGGYLKEYEYKEAFQKSYNELSKEEKAKQTELLKALPNFDKDVFFEISGIDINDNEVEEMTMQQLVTELGREVKIVK